MKISQIASTIFTPKTTGYTAAAGITLAVASGYSKNSSFKKMHKPFAYAGVIATMAHIGLIEWYHHKYKTK